MINLLHSLVYKPAKGWDPISEEYAKSYAQHVEQSQWNLEVDKYEKFCDGFIGKRVLDIGGGPGQFSIEFAKRGAYVQWHDISKNYATLLDVKAKEMGVKIDMSIGYMEDVSHLLSNPFDVVFNRVCFFYCRNDYAFGRLLYRLVKPGGYLILAIDTTDAGLLRGAQFGFRTWLNSNLKVKIGHPMTPPRRVTKILSGLPHDLLVSERLANGIEHIFLKKPKSA